MGQVSLMNQFFLIVIIEDNFALIVSVYTI